MSKEKLCVPFGTFVICYAPHSAPKDYYVEKRFLSHLSFLIIRVRKDFIFFSSVCARCSVVVEQRQMQSDIRIYDITQLLLFHLLSCVYANHMMCRFCLCRLILLLVFFFLIIACCDTAQKKMRRRRIKKKVRP